MKRKTMDMIAGASIVGALSAAGYVLMKNKKNMLDVIIEEIETMK